MFDPGGNRIVTASDDGTTQIFYCRLRQLRAFANEASSLADHTTDAAFSAEGASLVTVHGDGTIHMYNLEDVGRGRHARPHGGLVRGVRRGV